VTLGDTASPPDCTPGRIFASQDPLALDYYALDLVNQLRASRNPPQPPIESTLVEWLDNAYQLGIGTKGYNLVSLASPDGAASDAGAIDSSTVDSES
jgi:hypothetical protein